MSKNRSICTFTLALATAAGAAQHPSDDLENRLSKNPILALRVQALLPPGTSLQAASAGFHDAGEFIAALHVSRNLNIPFNELKADLKQKKHPSLNGALHDLRPELRSKGISHQVKRAEQQAQADLEQSGESATAARPTGRTGRAQKSAPEVPGPNGRS